MERFVLVSLFVIFGTFSTTICSEHRKTRKPHQFCIEPVQSGFCTFKKYYAGGVKVRASGITAPTATLQSNALSDVFHYLEQGTNVLGVLAAMAAGVAPYAGPIIAIFGTTCGILKQVTDKHTPETVIDVMQSSINTLAYEMDSRLDQIEGYVDLKFIDLYKDTVKGTLRELWNRWLGCAVIKNVADSLTCQEHQYNNAHSVLHLFTSYHKELKAGKQMGQKMGEVLKGNQYRELETTLEAFREYATLYILMASALIQNYKWQDFAEGNEDENRKRKRKTGKTDKYYCMMYSDQLFEYATIFKEYSENAQEGIIAYHKNSACKITHNVGGRYNHTDGTHRYDFWQTWSCTMEEGIKKKCNIYVKVYGKWLSQDWSKTICYQRNRKAIKKKEDDPEGVYRLWIDVGSKYSQYSHNSEVIPRHYAEPILKRLSEEYREKQEQEVKKYWDEHLKDFIEQWQNYINWAKTTKAGEPLTDEEKEMLR